MDNNADLGAPTDQSAAAVSSVVGPIGPAFLMYGFERCTDRNPDTCACATDEDVKCAVCGEIIDPGVLTYARQEGQPWMDPEDSEQDWVTLWWHTVCDMRTRKGMGENEKVPPAGLGVSRLVL